MTGNVPLDVRLPEEPVSFRKIFKLPRLLVFLLLKGEKRFALARYAVGSGSVLVNGSTGCKRNNPPMQTGVLDLIRIQDVKPAGSVFSRFIISCCSVKLVSHGKNSSQHPLRKLPLLLSCQS